MPTGISCVRVLAAGSTTSAVRFIDAVAGETLVSTLSGLPVGVVTFTGEAFSQSCSTVTPSTTPAYVSDPVLATVVPGLVGTVTLVLRPGGREAVDVTFADASVCSNNGQTCRVDAECCSASCQSNVCAAPAVHRNVIIFVADGLRPGSVTPDGAPTLYAIRQNGVNFGNSHSLFPTFTTPNASAIATGHLLGDTGDFSNTVFAGRPIFGSGTMTPFLENDAVLGDIDENVPGNNYLTEESLLAYARTHGYATAAVGKLGPVLIQDVTQGNPADGGVPTPTTVIIDDSTGKSGGLPIPGPIAAALTSAGVGTIAPDRTNGAPPTSQASNGFSGNNTTPGTLAANVTQQQFFADAVTKAILPTFAAAGEPFALVFWSRDPDGTQHNQGDSLNTLVPGINGPTSRAGVKNADNDLAQILATLNADPALAANTDLFVTADHGFSTISRHDLDATGARATTAYAAKFTYVNAAGRQDVNAGFLPPGFLAIDLAHALGLPLFDPDVQVSGDGGSHYVAVDPTVTQATATLEQHAAAGNGLVGGTGAVTSPTDATVVVAANGGSDLVYVPSHDVGVVTAIVNYLSAQDYVSGLFVDDAIGTVPGALPLSAIGLRGEAILPTPTVVVNFRTFATNSADFVNSEVEFADTTLQQGQGMHGSFGRGDTFNNMAAIGPDFKQGYLDLAPVSNADVAPTLATILGFDIPSAGSLKGRVLREALVGGPDAVPFTCGTQTSAPTGAGVTSVVAFQKLGAATYYDTAGFQPDVTAAPNSCH